MKIKSFFTVLVASVVVAMSFTACSNGEDISNGNQEKQIVNYAPAKTSKIQITSGNAVIATNGVASRACDVNHNMWDSIPAYPTEAEKAGILAYLATKPEGVDWPGYTTYLIQHVTGAHHIYSYYDYNNAYHEVDGTQSMELLRIIENSGDTIHCNNFNAADGNNQASHGCNCMTDGFQGALALNEYSSSNIPHWKVFYWEGNYYLGFDFNLKKDDGGIDPDGCYDDWIVKIIPINGEKRKTPYDPVDPEPEELKASVEVNLALNEPKETDDYISSKLSIHVRDTTDVEIYMPISADLYCPIDDMYILKNHQEGNYVYNETVESVSMEIAGQTVTLTCTFTDNAIIVKTQGINAAVLKELREKYGDGINFEIWNYYAKNTNRDDIQYKLNQSTCKCNTGEYINTVNNNDTYKLDCYVLKVDQQ